MLEKFQKEILKLAKRAGEKGEVPVGAIVVSPEGLIIGRGSNKTHATRDGLMHAEMVAIKQAQKKLGDWRLEGCEIFVTLEPCLMCLGAIGNARIDKVYFQLTDPLFGSVVSKLSPKDVARMYPKLKVERLEGGEVIRQLMEDFFRGLRQKERRVRMGAG